MLILFLESCSLLHFTLFYFFILDLEQQPFPEIPDLQTLISQDTPFKLDDPSQPILSDMLSNYSSPFTDVFNESSNSMIDNPVAEVDSMVRSMHRHNIRLKTMQPDTAIQSDTVDVDASSSVSVSAEKVDVVTSSSGSVASPNCVRNIFETLNSLPTTLAGYVSVSAGSGVDFVTSSNMQLTSTVTPTSTTISSTTQVSGPSQNLPSQRMTGIASAIEKSIPVSNQTEESVPGISQNAEHSLNQMLEHHRSMFEPPESYLKLSSDVLKKLTTPEKSTVIQGQPPTSQGDINTSTIVNFGADNPQGSQESSAVLVNKPSALPNGEDKRKYISSYNTTLPLIVL